MVSDLGDVTKSKGKDKKADAKLAIDTLKAGKDTHDLYKGVKEAI